jgi:hypothetical protein
MLYPKQIFTPSMFNVRTMCMFAAPDKLNKIINFALVMCFIWYFANGQSIKSDLNIHEKRLNLCPFLKKQIRSKGFTFFKYISITWKVSNSRKFQLELHFLKSLMKNIEWNRLPSFQVKTSSYGHSTSNE